MTEQQLRDVLSRVVPEAPDSVADPSPVVLAARRARRRDRVGAAALAAVVVVAGVAGVRSLDTDERGLAADRPPAAIPDPYTAAACPDPTAEWPLAGSADLGPVTAVRFCGRPVNGLSTADGAPDALVTGLAGFRAAVAELPEADPGRCATITMAPSDNRLLLEGPDGAIGVAADLCQDVVVDGRTLDGRDVTLAFVNALRAQRDRHDYYPAAGEPQPLTCEPQNVVTPAAPGSEIPVEAVLCTDDGAAPTPLPDGALDLLAEAWADGTVMDRQGVATCSDSAAAAARVQVRTDRGDTISIQAGSATADCDRLTYTGWLVPLPGGRQPGSFEVVLPAYVLPLTLDELRAETG